MNLTLAWRNIWRNLRRTSLTALAIAISAAILIFFMSLQFSSYETSINATTAIFQGHLQIQKRGYLSKPQIRTNLSAPEKVSELVSQNSLVKAQATRAFGFAIISSEDRSYGVQVVGVDPDSEPSVSTIPQLIRTGTYLSKTRPGEAIIGQYLAANLKIGIGQEVTMLGQALDGSLAASVYKVVGFFESGSVELDRNVMMLPLNTFQETFLMEQAAHSIVLKTDRIEDVIPLQQQLNTALASQFGDMDLVVLRWDELAPGLLQAINLDLVAGWLFFSSLIIIVNFTLINTVVLSLLERTREFGVMLALGSKPAGILKMVVCETAFILMLGLSTGLLLGSCIVTYYGAKGFYIPGGEEIMKLWHLPTAMRPRLSLASLLVGPSIIFTLGLLSSILPALRIFYLQPTEAMRST